jgi:hypothetical protein
VGRISRRYEGSGGGDTETGEGEGEGEVGRAMDGWEREWVR